MVIEIKISSPKKTLYFTADTVLKYATLNSRSLNINVNYYANRICELIQNWPNESTNTNVIDGEKYSIIVHDMIETRSYSGNTNFPENYPLLVSLIEELDN